METMKIDFGTGEFVANLYHRRALSEMRGETKRPCERRADVFGDTAALPSAKILALHDGIFKHNPKSEMERAYETLARDAKSLCEWPYQTHEASSADVIILHGDDCLFAIVSQNAQPNARQAEVVRDFASKTVKTCSAETNELVGDFRAKASDMPKLFELRGERETDGHDWRPWLYCPIAAKTVAN